MQKIYYFFLVELFLGNFDLDVKELKWLDTMSFDEASPFQDITLKTPQCDNILCWDSEKLFTAVI